jgi:hypothetical protein
MRLTDVQSRDLLQKHGVYVTEVCDKCGKILGPIRFTRCGWTGEWCSKRRSRPYWPRNRLLWLAVSADGN